VWSFYRQCLARAFSSAWDVANAISLAGGVIAGLAIWRLPRFQDKVQPLLWLVPLGAFTGWFLYRFLRAPFELHRELAVQLGAANEDRGRLAIELSERRDCQKIADMLTDRHQYGVHQILHKLPKSNEELPTWNGWVANWLQELMMVMRDVGCSPQDINHVGTISAVDLPIVVGTAIEVAVRMHAVRLERVLDVSKKYAERAEELRATR